MVLIEIRVFGVMVRQVEVGVGLNLQGIDSTRTLW